MSGDDPRPGAESASGTADGAAEVVSAGEHGRPRKAPNAYRTISEVADDLHIPQHVLRFWETKFPQVKPLKRGGGRRYYRPDDIALLRRISDLLYIQGYTIKGVQRLLRDGGGSLADDIPPPAPEERAVPGVDPAVEEAQLPMPGLAAPPSRPGQRETRPAAASEQLRLEAENARLRRLLGDVLVELEALRAMLA